MKKTIEFGNTFNYKLIYIFRINDYTHKGCLKIGDTTVHVEDDLDKLVPNCHKLNSAAKRRINSYTSTAGIDYDLLYTEIAVYKIKKLVDTDNCGKLVAFRDFDVHEVLKRSGIKIKNFDTIKKQNEWFITDLATAIKAIKCVKEEKSSLQLSDITKKESPIIFRPEQKEAIKKTENIFKKSNTMLWNAKMRFGKTLSALQVVKDMKFKKTIIITHRPVVKDGWHEDFKKIFYDNSSYEYASKKSGKKIEELISSNNSFVYFASIQDLRGSNIVGGKFDKDDDIFKVNWDFIVVDEAHEGTKTSLGQNVIKELKNNDIDKKTKVLQLSGTPFNLLNDYEETNIYTWDYVMEQEAKEDWIKNHFGDSNPYEELPKMNIFTYYLNKYFRKYIDIDDKAFNFKEFFRTWTGNIKKDNKHIPVGVKIGSFVHEKDVKSFLNLICKKSDVSNYPYSTDKYRDYFRHTLWVLPGVKEAKALSELLKEHSVFQNFNIVNVAGDGDEEIDTSNALKAVKKAITKHSEDTYTITLSCGRLTTGVTVPEWTAVLMLSGSYSTAASQYLQTIFRVQTPANINGKMKENCYVFDFAPDRTLKIIAETAQISANHKIKYPVVKDQLGAFLNFCPVIAIDNTGMKEFKVGSLLQELKKAYAEKVVRNGFDDVRLYNDELFRLDGIEIKEFNDLKKIIGKSKQTKKINDIPINSQGLTNEERKKLDNAEKKPRKELTPEEKELIKRRNEQNRNRRDAITILRGISIRMPLLVYGIDCDLDTEITIDNFADSIDDLSWKEFMPEGVDKTIFKKFSKYYDKDVFIASSRKIRTISKDADKLEPTKRVTKLAQLFSTFKNPDKETVLTPWNVVNLHMSNTLGGYTFFDNENQVTIDSPRFVDNGKITKRTFNAETKILEINSKTGLYPLYITYSLYRLKSENCSELTFKDKQELWDDIVFNNIYVVCKSSMAKSITRRTLIGYRSGYVNTHAFDNLIMQLKEKNEKVIKQLTTYSFWNKKGVGNMKFSAVVGNPPYQGTNHQQIYPYFYLTSIKIGDYVSLIFPTGWQMPKNGNNLSLLNKKEIKTDKQIVFIDNRENIFPGVAGAQFVNILLWQRGYDNKLNGKQLIYTDGKNPQETELLWNEKDIKKPKEITDLVNIVTSTKKFITLQSKTSKRKPYGLPTNVFKAYEKYNLIPFNDNRINETDIKIYGNKNIIKYISRDYQIPKKTEAFSKYKVFVPYAWGNMSKSAGLGGAYADIILAKPYEICTETFQESGCFNDIETAKRHAKYLMTKFVRALLFANKNSQHSTNAWGAVPIQDYTEEWWSKSINEIDEQLIEKYNVPKYIANFVSNSIQRKSESNIVNYD